MEPRVKKLLDDLGISAALRTEEPKFSFVDESVSKIALGLSSIVASSDSNTDKAKKSYNYLMNSADFKHLYTKVVSMTGRKIDLEAASGGDGIYNIFVALFAISAAGAIYIEWFLLAEVIVYTGLVVVLGVLIVAYLSAALDKYPAARKLSAV